MATSKVLVIGALPPPSGGMETVMEQMMSLKFDDYELIPFDVAKNSTIKSNILFNSITFIYRCIKLIGVLIVKQPKIVHIHMAAYMDFWQKAIYMKIANMFNKHTILHMHGSKFKEFYSKSRKKETIRKIIESSKAVIVLSESWKKYYSSIAKKSKIHIVKNAVESIDYNRYKRI